MIIEVLSIILPKNTRKLTVAFRSGRNAFRTKWLVVERWAKSKASLKRTAIHGRNPRLVHLQSQPWRMNRWKKTKVQIWKCKLSSERRDSGLSFFSCRSLRVIAGFAIFQKAFISIFLYIWRDWGKNCAVANSQICNWIRAGSILSTAPPFARSVRLLII